MANGKCSKCSLVLSENNCRPNILKVGHGYCFSCSKLHRRGLHDRDPEKFKYVILKSTAKKVGRVVEITLEEYRLIVKNKPCLYCGNSLCENIYGYGLDRVDNNIGYAKDNCVPCCWSCNTRKGRLEQLGFSSARSIELLKEINEIRSSEILNGNHAGGRS